MVAVRASVPKVNHVRVYLSINTMIDSLMTRVQCQKQDISTSNWFQIRLEVSQGHNSTSSLDDS